jgi:hypothetical protein
MVWVIRCKQHKGIFCDCYGTAFYDLKTPAPSAPRSRRPTLMRLVNIRTYVAMARESRLMLEVVVGPRTQESATKMVEGAARGLAPDCWPLWSSDGWEPYFCALRLVFAVLIHFIKGKGPGRPKESQVAPDPREHIEGQDASASCWPERPRLDTQGIANLQCCNYFKDHVGSTRLFSSLPYYTSPPSSVFAVFSNRFFELR